MNFRLPICKVFLLFIISIFFCSCNSNNYPSILKAYTKNQSYQDCLTVHFIDVGQGDAILVQGNTKNLLIDAGPKENVKKLNKYLKKLKIKKLDYVVATHPHEDHIGGMKEIINNYKIGMFFAPKKTVNTTTFEDMLHSLKKKDLKINIARAGVSIYLGGEITCEFLAPLGDLYENINNYSVVMMIRYKNNKFLLTGDAEKLSEREMLNNNANLDADVIKIGHHGSNTSSSNEFLQRISPTIAVISCAKINDYGHPNKEVLGELHKRNITVYRTDKNRDIILVSDGETILKK